MVSSLGLRDLKQAGQRNLISLKLPGFSRFPCRRGSGTDPGVNFSLVGKSHIETFVLHTGNLKSHLQSSQSRRAIASSLELLASKFRALT